MKVWWCEVHNAEAVNNDDLPEEQTECWLYLGLSLGEKPIAPCRMVEMQLVSADARMVWWCQEHSWNGWPDEDVCLWAREGRDKGAYNTPCRMVEMYLTLKEEPPKRRHTLVVFLDVPHD